jgi:hypothetical protein
MMDSAGDVQDIEDGDFDVEWLSESAVVYTLR